jgi:hypothetical protein
MYVERVLSLNNGWSVLTEQKHSEWQELLAILKALGNGKEKELDGSQGISSTSIKYTIYSLSFLRRMREQGWIEDLNNGFRHDAKVRAGILKNRIFVNMAGVEGLMGGSFATDFYLNMPQSFRANSIDIGILFIPTASAISRFIEVSLDNSEAFILPSEEFCRAEMVKFGPLTSQTPIVLALFSPTETEEIIFEEITPAKVSTPAIERTIEFAPEYYQAGVGLLSYFGEILRQKDPNTKAKVRIEQDGRIVRLHIESPAGEIETIEKELDQYALVISNQAPPESLFENRAHIMRLEHSLEMMRHQVKMAQDLKELTDGLHTKRVNNLEEQVEFLKNQVAAQLLQNGQFIQLVGQQAGSHERMQAALLAHSQMLFKDLLHEASGNQRLAEAVSSLQHNLLSGLAIIDVEDKLEQALATIKETKPGFLGRIQKELEGAAYKASASSTVTWVATWIAAHT